MASKALAGFLKGMTDYGVRQMDRAAEDKRQMQKALLLEQLRKDTEKEMALFREELNKKKVDKSMSTDDYTSGKRTLRNEYGDELGSVDLPSSAVESYKAEQEDRSLDRTYKTKQIENFDADNRRADEQLAISRGHLGVARENAAKNSTGGLDGTGAKEKPDSITIGQEIVYKNSKVADDLVRAGVPAEVVMQTAAHAAAQAKARGGGMSEAQNIFLRAASILRSKAKANAE